MDCAELGAIPVRDPIGVTAMTPNDRRRNAIAVRTFTGTDPHLTVEWIVNQYLDLMDELDEGPPKTIDPMMDVHYDDVTRRMRAAGLNPENHETYKAFISRLRGW